MAHDILASALDLADCGIPLIPCLSCPDERKRDKKPLTEHGLHDASIDPKQIKSWWVQYPKALIGVPTGQASDLDVLDIDPRHGGDKWLAANRHRLPRTRPYETQSGGIHMQFRARPGLRCSTNK